MKELQKDLTAVSEKVDVSGIAAALGITSPAAITFVQFSLANALLMNRKNEDYGTKNIARFGAYGCIVRMSDKLERVVHLMNNRRRRAVNESIADSFRDFANYAILAQMCEEHQWPL